MRYALLVLAFAFAALVLPVSPASAGACDWEWGGVAESGINGTPAPCLTPVAVTVMNTPLPVSVSNWPTPDPSGTPSDVQDVNVVELSDDLEDSRKGLLVGVTLAMFAGVGLLIRSFGARRE